MDQLTPFLVLTPRPPTPSIEVSEGETIEMDLTECPDAPWTTFERATVTAIVGKSGIGQAVSNAYDIPYVHGDGEDRKDPYRDCRIEDPPDSGTYRELTRDEKRQQARGGADRRWATVTFEKPCDDGTERTGFCALDSGALRFPDPRNGILAREGM